MGAKVAGSSAAANRFVEALAGGGIPVLSPAVGSRINGDPA